MAKEKAADRRRAGRGAAQEKQRTDSWVAPVAALLSAEAAPLPGLYPMKNLLLLGVLILSLTARAADAPVAPPGSPLAPLASLVGGLWIGAVPVPEGRPPLKIELQFTWTENHQAIRFDSAFVGNAKRKPYTSGLYAWDGTKGKLVIFYVDNQGDLTEGTIRSEGATLVNELTLTEPNGKTNPLQVRLTMVGTDVFTNEIFLMKDGAWAPFVTVKYVRQK